MSRPSDTDGCAGAALLLLVAFVVFPALLGLIADLFAALSESPAP